MDSSVDLRVLASLRFSTLLDRARGDLGETREAVPPRRRLPNRCLELGLTVLFDVLPSSAPSDGDGNWVRPLMLATPSGKVASPCVRPSLRGESWRAT
jgi:hypothetical protein